MPRGRVPRGTAFLFQAILEIEIEIEIEIEMHLFVASNQSVI
jgi:hypothetical protein